MLGGLETLLGGAALALVGVLVGYLRGRSAGQKQEQGKAAQGYAETRRKADEANIVGDDPAVARDFLRTRDTNVR
ncbi:hypothetical protein QCN27_17780 [Cereibacter sp. SYSU M97828]|nr:hypothetical protein [Cereibacter flavus]